MEAMDQDHPFELEVSCACPVHFLHVLDLTHLPS